MPAGYAEQRLCSPNIRETQEGRPLTHLDPTHFCALEKSSVRSLIFSALGVGGLLHLCLGA